MLIHLILVITLRSVLSTCATNKDVEAWGTSRTCPSPMSPQQKELELGLEHRHPGSEIVFTDTSLEHGPVHSQKQLVRSGARNRE